MAFLDGKSDNNHMGSGYWRVEFLRPAKGDDRCVQLHGQLDEVVGPMSIEMAEAWIDRFDIQQPAEEPAATGGKTSAVPPKRKLPKGESAK
jgi:hypothetical protein